MDVYFLFGFLLSIWTFCGFEFCYKTSVLTMSSQDKIKRKSTEEKCFCRHFFTDCLPLFVKWRQGCLSLDEDLLLLRMPVFLHNSRITSYGSSFLCSFEDLLHSLTLKLSAVILAPAGTVYMLLGDKGNDGDNSIVTKLITRRVRIARRLVAKISPHHALPNRSPVGIPRGGRHHCFSWILHRGQVPDADLIFYTVHFLR